uniref:Uncharacterized protein n=2 Tax=Panagrolaimus sp. JU765 TaxID=591449 RepID=A0AC34RM56_9BILA
MTTLAWMEDCDYFTEIVVDNGLLVIVCFATTVVCCFDRPRLAYMIPLIFDQCVLVLKATQMVSDLKSNGSFVVSYKILTEYGQADDQLEILPSFELIALICCHFGLAVVHFNVTFLTMLVVFKSDVEATRKRAEALKSELDGIILECEVSEQPPNYESLMDDDSLPVDTAKSNKGLSFHFVIPSHNDV